MNEKTADFDILQLFQRNPISNYLSVAQDGLFHRFCTTPHATKQLSLRELFGNIPYQKRFFDDCIRKLDALSTDNMIDQWLERDSAMQLGQSTKTEEKYNFLVLNRSYYTF